MSIENKKTLEIYNQKAKTYLKTGIEHDSLNPEKAKLKREQLEKFIKNNIGTLPKDSKVFEIGSANGTNAKYIEKFGYRITASDIADDFINAIKSKELNTIKFNVLENEFNETYSAILAWRVFVHFTKSDVLEVLKKIYAALENDGLFIFNVINRETRDVDEEWVDFPNEYHMGAKRYYRYFSKDELNEIITKIGYTIHSFHKEGGENNNKWLVYVLKK